MKEGRSSSSSMLTQTLTGLVFFFLIHILSTIPLLFTSQSCLLSSCMIGSVSFLFCVLFLLFLSLSSSISIILFSPWLLNIPTDTLSLALCLQTELTTFCFLLFCSFISFSCFLWRCWKKASRQRQRNEKCGEKSVRDEHLFHFFLLARSLLPRHLAAN